MAVDRTFSWRRCTAWIVALGVHAVFLVSLSVPMRLDHELAAVVPEPPTAAERGSAVTVTLPPAVEPAAPAPRRSGSAIDGRTNETPRARRRARAAALAREPALAETLDDTLDGATDGALDDASRDASVDAPVARPLVFLDDDARAKLPHESLYSAAKPAREGDFHTPGHASDDDVFYRPRALEPNTTRFERVWQPAAPNLLEDWLGRLVEMTSGKASIPLNEKFNLVCGGSIVGLGGGCVIVRDGGTGVIVERPPPAPWARSNRVQCRELRERLEASESAEEIAFLLDRLTALCTGREASGADGGGMNDAPQL